MYGCTGAFGRNKEFYPDGVAQIYPLIYEFLVKEKKKQRILYDQFTEKFQWQKLNKKEMAFCGQ